MIVVLFLALTVTTASCSVGDRSPFYRRCLKQCQDLDCSPDNIDAFVENQPSYERWLGWTCPQECSYRCMWKTVDEARKQGYSQTFQFHGKWPFVRILGIQEPASALFSVLNLLSHVVCLRKLVRVVPEGGPMIGAWLWYGGVSINAWFWSTVFHTRDLNWTEKLDYFCAFSVVVSLFTVFVARVCCRDASWTRMVSGLVICVAVYVRHVYTMWFIEFDYGYNMKVNIAVGVLNSFCWLGWCFKNRSVIPHVYWVASAIIFLGLAMSLELLEFQPLFYFVDSHALWHLATVPIHFLYYRFAVEDCIYLKKVISEEKKLKLP